MRMFQRSIPAALAAGAAALATPRAATANGGDIHIGGATTGLSLPAVLGVVGFVVLVVAFFVFNWARYRREQARGAGPSASPPTGETGATGETRETGETGPDSNGRPSQGER
jgi:hypothetical protein